MSDGATSEQAVSAPAGSGNAPGFGESFGLNLNTGQASYTIPIPVPKGVAGQVAKLDLVYSQNAGNGVLGMGWALPVRTVEQRLDFGVPGDVEARYLADGVEIVEVSAGHWRARKESAFDRFERTGDGWTILQRDGGTVELGLSPAARVADPGHPDRVLQWLPERVLDASGNAVTYAWSVQDGTPYLTSVSWAVHTVSFGYEDRPDVLRNGRAGWMRLTTRRCASITLEVQGVGAVRRWDLTYQDAQVSLLTQVRLTSLGPATDGSGDLARPAQRFTYAVPDPAAWHARFVGSDALYPPPPLTDPDALLTQLDAGPLPGVLAGRGGGLWFWPQDVRGDFTAPRRLSSVPVGFQGVRDSRLQVVDIDGDGAVDLLVGVGTALPRGYADGAHDWQSYVAYPRSATTPDLGTTTRFADLDGDGRVDALGQVGRTIVWWHNLGADGWAAAAHVVLADLADDDPLARLVDPPDLTDPAVLLADMTGDGLADLVRVRSGQVTYWPNLGRGRFAAPVLMTGSPRVRTDDGTQLLLTDVDGDGCADLVLVGAAGVQIVPNLSGASWGAPVLDPLVPTPIPGTVSAVPGASGRGSAVLWCSPRGSATGYVRYDPTAGSGYLLTGTDNGAGLVATVEYDTAAAHSERDRFAGRPWPDEVPFPVAVVSATTVTDGVSGQTSRTAYRYHEGWYDERERSFEGFARVERDEIGDASRPTSRVVHHFVVGADRLPGNGPEQALLNKLLSRVEHLQLDGSALQDQPVLVEDTDYSVQTLEPAARGWVRVERTARRWRERTDDERAEERTLDYDDGGDVVAEHLRHRGTSLGAPVPEIALDTTLTFAVHPQGRVLGKPASIVRRDGAGVLIGEVRRFYDGPDYVGLAAGLVDQGLLTRELRWAMTVQDAHARYDDTLPADVGGLGYEVLPDADGRDALFAVAVEQAHDTAGRLVGVRSTPGQTTTYTYDASGTHRATSTTPQGTTTVATDLATGQPVSVVDPDGTTVSMRYDAQGRLTSVVLPGDTLAMPSRTYAYLDAVPGVVTVRRRLRHGEAATADSAIVFDGLGREQQRREVLSAGRVIVSGCVVRTPFGDAAAEYDPTFEAALDYAPTDLTGRTSRRFEYDSQGRPVRTTDHDGAVSSTRYAPFEIVSTDALGVERRDRVDAAHRRVAVEESGVTTTYAPDATGHLSVHSDAHGVVARYAYDGLGNRVEVAHRDAGTWRTLNDARGRAVEVVDPAGARMSASYDGMGRIVSFAVDGVQREIYTYDDAPSHGVGRLRTATYPGGSQTFAYDAQGRVASRTYAVGGRSWTLGFERDALGQLVRLVQPDGSATVYERYDSGLVRSVPGVLTLVDYEPRRLATTVTHANGVVRTTSYAAGTARVVAQRTVGVGGAVLEDAAYGYDALGQCTSVDEPDGRVTFAYDPLRQLVGTTDARPGGVDEDFTYQARTLLGTDGAVLTAGDVAHPTRPDTLAVDGGAPSDLSYDVAGRLGALPGRTFAWDAKGQLASVVRADGTTVAYEYDHRGSRVHKTVTGGPDTVFLGPYAEVRDGNLVTYAVLQGLRIAVDHGGVRHWIHTDPRASATFFTDAAGTRIARIDYRAFGNSAQATGPAPTQVFAFQEWDADAELYYAQRRWYSPTIARYLSPDGYFLHHPEKGVDDPRRLDLYAYCANDPVNNVDPDGASFWTVLGGIVGVIIGIAVAVLTIAAFASGIGAGLLAIGLIIGLTIAGYAGASAARGTALGDFLKGMLIGFNAGLTVVFASAIFGPAIGLALGVIGFLSVFDGIRQSAAYQVILGWSSWLMPTTWLVNGIGLAFFAVNLILAGVTGNQVPGLAITSISFDLATCSFVMKGGAFSDANPIDTAYDMGHFVFVDSKNTSPDGDVPHETGHGLASGRSGRPCTSSGSSTR
ncbi:toxin TcdB middle/N-terminal domain-containing protein [Cellulomonas sp. McL0617]|uniref:toxin TcdB middle/N-terminal domain-containing protein n=1 Tax=Cellulomonas sp. McL0617 TaxID=3415675 RepID=UPI003CE83DA5